MWTKPNDTKNNSIIKRTAIASASAFAFFIGFNLAINLITFEYEFPK